MVAFDYDGQVKRVPKPDTLTPANVVADILAVADAAQADTFAYYGYSWLALMGLQLALRTDRLSALIMGGFPPLDAPYAESLRLCRATYELAVAAEARAAQPGALPPAPPAPGDWSGLQRLTPSLLARQDLTLYEALQGFDDRAAQAQITCPRLCFVGSADELRFDHDFGDVQVSVAGPILRGRAELEAMGWDVRVLDGLDHGQTMQAAHLVPLIRPWLMARLRPTG